MSVTAPAFGMGFPEASKMTRLSLGGLEVWVVDDIEEFRTKLRLQGFPDGEVFEEREIQVHQAGTDHRVSSCVTKTINRVRNGKARDFDVIIGITRVDRVLAVRAINPIRIRIWIGVVLPKVVTTEQDRERCAR